jgi:hypothetical protein
MQSVWEGLSSYTWNEAQLASLQAELARADLLASYRTSMESERVFSVKAREAGLDMGAWSMAKGESLDFDGSGEFRPRLGHALLNWLLLPRGWRYQNMLGTDRFYVEISLPALDAAHHRIDLNALQRGIEARSHRGSTPYNWTGGVALTPLESIYGRVAYRENAIDEAVIACALERYRLSHGVYPMALDDLSPAYLDKAPCDVLTGGPLHYRLNADGTFALYSIGLDGKDDGGQVATCKEGGVDMDHGDWAWPSR